MKTSSANAALSPCRYTCKKSSSTLPGEREPSATASASRPRSDAAQRQVARPAPSLSQDEVVPAASEQQVGKSCPRISQLCDRTLLCNAASRAEHRSLSRLHDPVIMAKLYSAPQIVPFAAAAHDWLLQRRMVFDWFFQCGRLSVTSDQQLVGADVLQLSRPRALQFAKDRQPSRVQPVAGHSLLLCVAPSSGRPRAKTPTAVRESASKYAPARRRDSANSTRKPEPPRE